MDIYPFNKALAASHAQTPSPSPTAPNDAALPDHLPHDIHELIPYPAVEPTWLWVVGIGLIVIFLLILGWLLWKKMKKPNTQVIRQDPITVISEQINNFEPISPFNGAEYFFELSWLLRQLIELLTPVKATDLTINELRSRLESGLPIATSISRDILAFLERADMIKFADSPTTMKEAQHWHDQVKTWCRRLIPAYRLKQQELAYAEPDSSKE